MKTYRSKSSYALSHSLRGTQSLNIRLNIRNLVPHTVECDYNIPTKYNFSVK